MHADGATVVVSSHLLTEVEATCTHVAVLQSGALIAEGELRTLLDADSTGLVIVTPDADLAVSTLLAAGVAAYRDDAASPRWSCRRATHRRSSRCSCGRRRRARARRGVRGWRSCSPG